MRIKGKISVNRQAAFFGYSLLYLLSVVLPFYAENKLTQLYSSETTFFVTASFPDNQKLVLKEAALASTTGVVGFISEKESFVLPAIFFLEPILLLPPSYFSSYTSSAFRSCFLYLIRVLPNAP